MPIKNPLIKILIPFFFCFISSLGVINLFSVTVRATTIETWQKAYPYAYEVKVIRPTPVYKVTIGKYDYQNKRHYFTTLKKGQVVRTMFSGNGGVSCFLTGGRFGTFKKDGNPSNKHYMFSADWKSGKSFKIIKTYHHAFF
ncbi:hypothetical protein OQI89_08945 [Lentilactobacillus diolivorans]|uniref:hypothetical protein n=1 Tax=Lentilactobacillus diolivorans TaxID=179838 RepID=UPI0024694243|nr:hypothetical protein [Lentilactobacillus diolivorans]MDH5105976.1 hypothetical protein [Lentilactobacillus diolivorans]